MTGLNSSKGRGHEDKETLRNCARITETKESAIKDITATAKLEWRLQIKVAYRYFPESG